LQNVIEELNINASSLQRNLDNTQKQNFQMQKEKIDLEKEAEENKKEINELKKSKSSIEEFLNKNSSINQSNVLPRSSPTEISLDETLNKTTNNVNLNNSNVSSSNINKIVSTLKANTAVSSQSTYTFRSSITQANLHNKTQSSTVSVAATEKNINRSVNLNRESLIVNGNELTNKSKNKDNIIDSSFAYDYNEKKSQIADELSKPFKLQKKKSRYENKLFKT
jgi:hypothetical protein